MDPKNTAQKLFLLSMASVILLSPASALARPAYDAPAAVTTQDHRSPDSQDRAYESAVKSGKKTYTAPGGAQVTVKKSDIDAVAKRDAYRKTVGKHVPGEGVLTPEALAAVKAERLRSSQAAEKKRIRDARAQYKKVVAANVKKANAEIKKNATEYAKNKKTLEKQQSDQAKAISKLVKKLQKAGGDQKVTTAEYAAMDKYRKADTESNVAKAQINRLQKALEQSKSGSAQELKKMYGADVSINKDNIDNMRAILQEAYNKKLQEVKDNQTKAEKTKDDNKAGNDAANKKLVGNVKSEKIIKQIQIANTNYINTREKRETLRSDYLSLTPAQRKKLKSAIAKGTPKPAALTASAKQSPGTRAGEGGGPSAAASMAPSGSVGAKSFANKTAKVSNHAEGDIMVITYLDTPGNADKTDQRIGDIQVKIDKISGEDNCDTHQNGTAKTWTKSFTKNKKTKKEKFVHGTATFVNCAPGKYKVTYIGRDGYKLRDEGDRVQTITVDKDNHTTEAVFTVVKGTKGQK